MKKQRIYVDTSVIGGCLDIEFQEWSNGLFLDFKHIVHYEKIRKFNIVNLEMGYKSIEIYSPREVTSYGKEF